MFRSILLCLAAMAALSAAAADDAAPSRYQKDLAACLAGPVSSRANCEREAAAAKAAAASAAPSSGDESAYQRNAMRRCQTLPEADREDCRARVRGEGKASGSVQGGGIYRETVTRTVGEPVPAAASASAASAASAASK